MPILILLSIEYYPYRTVFSKIVNGADTYFVEYRVLHVYNSLYKSIEDVDISLLSIEYYTYRTACAKIEKMLVLILLSIEWHTYIEVCTKM